MNKILSFKKKETGGYISIQCDALKEGINISFETNLSEESLLLLLKLTIDKIESEKNDKK